MGDKRRPLLLVEDDLALQKQLKWAFADYEVVLAQDKESALAQLRRFEPAVITMDLGLPPLPDDPAEGFKLLQETLSLAPDAKVIVLTGQNDRTNAVRAIGLGAYDFYPKPFEPETRALTIERAYRFYELQQENRRLQEAASAAALRNILTRDPEMQRLCRMT